MPACSFIRTLRDPRWPADHRMPARQGGTGSRPGLPACLFLSLAVLCGCGSGETADNPQAPIGALPGEAQNNPEVSRFHDDVSTPIISISKLDDQLTYRVHGEPVSRVELDRLTSNIASYSPDVTIVLSPGPTITEDEIRLVRARLREKGLRNIHTLSQTRGKTGIEEENTGSGHVPR